MGRFAALAAAALSLGSVVLPAASSPASAGLFGSGSPYIVGDLNGIDASLASSLVSSVGGQVVEPLDAANAVLANLTPLEVTLLQVVPGVVLTPDITVAVQGMQTGPAHSPSDVFTKETGAQHLWNQGDNGSGVNVAVLDTGIAPLPDFAARLVGGVDLSGGNNPFSDTYGHGTFDAGLIAGNGASSNGAYTGEAPGAGLVSVKVAGSSGQTDLATVIAGVGWTIANRASMHISVLNMSLGYLPIASTAIDPLDIAVEHAWQQGIAVVASSGNSGPWNGTVLSPGDDPLVITVGALDDMGTASTSDDTMAPFSSAGPTNPDGWLKPDLVASGRSVVSLRTPGSTIDTQNPSARIGSANFVGSGTSFSAAITSGAAALVLSADPGLSPNQLKADLLGTTNLGPIGNPLVDGHGALNALAAVAGGVASPPALVQYPSVTAVALGATVQLSDTWSESTWNGQAWNGQAWNGQAWNGQAWNGQAWNGQAWNGQAWNGQAWNGQAWNGQAWNGQAWNGQAWNGQAWNGQAWNGQAWNGQAWNDSSWS